MGGTDNMRFCTAHRKCDGGPCTQPAMRGQNVCRLHGGGAKQNREAAASRIAEAATVETVRRFAQPRPVRPMDAMDEELARCQGWVDFLETRIRDRPDEMAWVGVYQAERAQLAKLAHQMILARTDERQTVLAEREVSALEEALAGMLRELGHDPNTSYVRGIVARHLRAALEPTGTDTATGTDGDDDDGPSNVRTLPVRF